MVTKIMVTKREYVVEVYQYIDGIEEKWFNVYYIGDSRAKELHKEGGPAVKCRDGTEKYYCHGKLHRDDGPAIIYPSGNKYYYINGTYLTKHAFDLYQESEKDPQSCDGKVVEISGKKYVLKEL